MRTTRRLAFVVAAVALLMAVSPTLWCLLSLEWVDDAYALWGAGEMVVRYMDDHDGRWPKGWGDLRSDFDQGGGRVGGWSFAEYQRRVRIRWDVDPSALEAAAKANPRPTFRVISSRALLAGTLGGREPNEILYHYLRRRPARPRPSGVTGETYLHKTFTEIPALPRAIIFDSP